MVSERKLRRKEEKKGLCDDTEESTNAEVVATDTEDTLATTTVENEAASDEITYSPPKEARRKRNKKEVVTPISELPSKQKSKTKSPRKKKKRQDDEDDTAPVEFRVNGVIVDRDVKGGAKQNWQGVYMLLFRSSTPLGQKVAFFIIGVVIVSVSVAVLDSVKTIRSAIGDYLLVMEHAFTIFFTVEYILRIICLRKPSKYIFSLLGFIDICALVPSYVGYIFPEARPLLHLAVLRIFRVMRVFRLMRLARFVDASAALTDNIETNRRNIAVFLVALFTVILVIGCAMYLIEGDQQFSNIPISLYWTVVTITTVGYGDISPHTIVGRMLATLVMFVGYGIIASPTLLSAPPAAPAISDVVDCPKCTKLVECVKCFQKFHQESANFCCMCSAPLRQQEVKAPRVRSEERRRGPRVPIEEQKMLPSMEQKMLPSMEQPAASSELPIEEIKLAEPVVVSVGGSV